VARIRLLRVVGAMLLSCPVALAQDAAAAAALFDRGLADMLAGKFDTGCPALAESYRLDPQAGALFTLAECEAKWGKLASAFVHYEEYLMRYDRMNASERAAQRNRPAIAASKRDALRADLPRLTLSLPDGAPPGTVVERNGVELTRASLGVPLPIDPGEHSLSVRLPDGSEREHRITLARGEQKELQLALPARAAPPPVSTARSAPSAAPPGRDRAGASRQTSPWLYVAGGAALVGIGVGTVGGVLAMKRTQEIDDNCTGNVCNDEGLAAADDAKRYALVSTIGFSVGAAGLAAGAVLLLARPSATDRSARSRAPALQPAAFAGPRGATLGLEGAW
jgi:hypothetical protein